jgi:hypothetical protein
MSAMHRTAERFKQTPAPRLAFRFHGFTVARLRSLGALTGFAVVFD